MKKYSVNCHYDMVIYVDVIADSEEEALRLAYDKAADMPLDDAECVGHSECVTDVNDADQATIIAREHELVKEAVRKYVGWCTRDIIEANMGKMDNPKAFKAKLARLAYDNDPCLRGLMPWSIMTGCFFDEDHTCQKSMAAFFNDLEYRTNPRTELYNRYARLYARHEFERMFKGTVAAKFGRKVEGTSKADMKQAWRDALRVLIDNTPCCEPADGSGVWAQMVVRYYPSFDDRTEYYNLFIYYKGADQWETSWQWISDPIDGKYRDEDYHTEQFKSEDELLAHFFYTSNYDAHDDVFGDCNTMSEIWVDA